jgi:hypothetical protein
VQTPDDCLILPVYADERTAILWETIAALPEGRPGPTAKAAAEMICAKYRIPAEILQRWALDVLTDHALELLMPEEAAAHDC